MPWTDVLRKVEKCEKAMQVSKKRRFFLNKLLAISQSVYDIHNIEATNATKSTNSINYYDKRH